MTDRPTKTLALVATMFYPAPTVAAVRWTQFARVLPSLGWRLVVMTRFYGHAASQEELLREVGPGVEVRYIDHPIDAQPEPIRVQGVQSAGDRHGGLAKLVRSKLTRPLRDLLNTPDNPRGFWANADTRLLEEVRRAQPDVIAATIPPFGKLRCVMRVAERESIPLVVEYRDSFMIDKRFGPYGLRRLRAGAYERFDRDAHTRSALVVHQIPPEHRWARLRYAEARDRMRLLTNGFPPQMLESDIEPLRENHGRTRVLIAGSMEADEMLHLAHAVKAANEGGANLVLTLVGRPVANHEEISDVLGDRVEHVGAVEHRTSLGYILGADILVNYIGESRRDSFLLSTKLFEYIAADKPVIEINPSRSDTFFVRQLPGILVLEQPSVAALTEALERAACGEGRAERGARERLLREQAWPHKAKQLAGWLDALMADEQAQPSPTNAVN